MCVSALRPFLLPSSRPAPSNVHRTTRPYTPYTHTSLFHPPWWPARSGHGAGPSAPCPGAVRVEGCGGVGCGVWREAWGRDAEVPGAGVEGRGCGGGAHSSKGRVSPGQQVGSDLSPCPHAPAPTPQPHSPASVSADMSRIRPLLPPPMPSHAVLPHSSNFATPLILPSPLTGPTPQPPSQSTAHTRPPLPSPSTPPFSPSPPHRLAASGAVVGRGVEEVDARRKGRVHSRDGARLIHGLGCVLCLGGGGGVTVT